jgi:hypothetical protein
MSICLQRREFIAGIGGAAAWPLAARAQQRERVRRIGVLMPYVENDPRSKTIVSAFTQALADFGWSDGRNVRIDLRWGGDDILRCAWPQLGHQLDERRDDDLLRRARQPDRHGGRAAAQEVSSVCHA